MTLYRFNKLTESEQLNAVSAKGVMVSKRKDEVFLFVLYQLDNIYIEFKYHREHQNVASIRGFTSKGKTLLPYIENIDLTGLY